MDEEEKLIKTEFTIFGLPVFISEDDWEDYPPGYLKAAIETIKFGDWSCWMPTEKGDSAEGT